MANLRSLLYGYGEGAAITPGELSVWNTNTQSESNGGQCCLWTVPAGITTAVFEIWSGGGGGAFGCCCMFGGGAGSGGYGLKRCTVAAGQQIRICAAGSTCCDSGNNSGHTGNCSFVCSLGGGGQSTWESKVCGGCGVTDPTRCQYWINCYTCCSQCYCCGGTGSNVDFSIAGTTGVSQPTQYCYGNAHQYAANAPFMSGPRVGNNGCWSGSRIGGVCGFGTFPGGGGFSSQVHSNECYWGGPGAGGLVYVLFY